MQHAEIERNVNFCLCGLCLEGHSLSECSKREIFDAPSEVVLRSTVFGVSGFGRKRLQRKEGGGINR